MAGSDMEQTPEQVFERLQEAIDQWGAEISSAQSELEQSLSQAKDQADKTAGQSLREFASNLLPKLLKVELQPVAQAFSDVVNVLKMTAERVGQVQQAVDELRAAYGTHELAEKLAGVLRNEIRQLAPAGGAPEPPPAEPPPEPDIPAGLRGDKGQRLRMGEILVKAGVLDEGQLAEALRTQQDEPQRRLGEILKEMGFASENLVAKTLAHQLHFPFVALETTDIHEDAAGLISRKVAKRHTCIPISIDAGRLVLAMANPLDLVAIEDVELASERRFQIEPVVAVAPDIVAAIDRMYGPSLIG